MHLIAYFRVSTQGQGDSGLGLDAQRDAVERYAASVNGAILRTYTEVESGKRGDRPELLKALSDCRRSKARLVVAKLDRLSRNVAFLTNLLEAGCDFVCCDNPHATRLTIHILAAVAEDETRRISERTKDSLRAFRQHKRVPKRIREEYPNGVPAEIAEATAGKLGADLPQCRNLTEAAACMGRMLGVERQRQKANEAYADLAEIMTSQRTAGRSLAEIADHLNQLGYTTRRGQAWHKQTVSRVLQRFAS